MLWPPAPSTNEACQFLKICGEPSANDRAAGAAVSGSAPQTLISGSSALIALPTPVIRPPPPIAPAIGVGQHRHRVCRSAQFVGIDRLQVFKLEPDVGKTRAQFEPH